LETRSRKLAPGLSKMVGEKWKSSLTLAKGPEVIAHFRPGSFQQRTNTSWSSGDANPRIHGGCFGVWGHTSCEALKM